MLLSPSRAEVWLNLARQEPHLIGFLDSPRTSGHRQIAATEAWWAGDNDAYSQAGFDPDSFMSMLEKTIYNQARCLFIASPDVVGDPEETHNLFTIWGPVIQEMGFPVAYISQDGLEAQDVPWDNLQAFFAGGSTRWKLGRQNFRLMKEAKRRGKWLHIGRVNSKKRIMFSYWAGADSFDGTHFAIEPAGSARRVMPLLRSLASQQRL